MDKIDPDVPAPGLMRLSSSAMALLILTALNGSAVAQTAQQPLPQTQSQPQPSRGPLQPGQWRVTVHTPTDWVMQSDPRAPGVKSYSCMPLACYDPATLTISAAPTLARHPDPRALDRLAKVQLPRTILAQSMSTAIMTGGGRQTQLMSSVVGTVAGYPAVILDAKIVEGARTAYLETNIIFENSAMLTVSSTAGSQEDAKRHIALFLSGTKLEEGPVADPEAPVAPPAPAVPSVTAGPPVPSISPAWPPKPKPEMTVEGRQSL